MPELLLGRTGLSRYEVTAADPGRHRVVRLTLAVARDLQGSSAVPRQRPPFVVVGQDPAAGTVVPVFGVPIPNGVDLGPSVVHIRPGVRGPR